jgi:hypothetical protein
MPEEGWTEVASTSISLSLLTARIEKLDARMAAIESQLKEILGHCRQQSIIQRASLPLTQQEDPDVCAARAANLALRKKLPIPLHKARS